jgi:hypothetical protein
LFTGGREVKRFSQVEFSSPIKVFPGRDLPCTILLKELPSKQIVAEIRSVFTNALGQAIGDERIHFTAILEGGEKNALREEMPLPKDSVIISDVEIYKRYFHGTTFRIMQGVSSIDKERTISRFHKASEHYFKSRPMERFWVDPLHIEFIFQSCGIFEMVMHSNFSLPWKLASLELFKDQTNGTIYSVNKAERGDAQVRYNSIVLDDEGHVKMKADDFVMVRKAGVREEDKFSI